MCGRVGGGGIVVISERERSCLRLCGQTCLALGGVGLGGRRSWCSERGWLYEFLVWWLSSMFVLYVAN